MKNILKVVLALVVVVLFIDSSLQAKGKRVDIDNINNLVNIAGKQRMLSQRIAKDYLYSGAGIIGNGALEEMRSSLKEFINGLDILNRNIDDKDIQNLIKFVKISTRDLSNIIKKPFNIDNAQLVLDLTESMLEGSQYIVDSLKEKYNIKSVKVVDRSGKQRMLSQRIAKYYIAYQLGIKDKNTIEQTNMAIEQFDANNKFLMNYKDNTTIIKEKLSKVNRLWEIVHNFYLNIQRGGLPIIVYDTTNDITNDMDKITNMYVKIYSKK